MTMVISFPKKFLLQNKPFRKPVMTTGNLVSKGWALSHLKGLSACKANGTRRQKKCCFSQLWKVSNKYQILVDLFTINTSRIVRLLSLSGERHLHTAPSKNSLLVSFIRVARSLIQCLPSKWLKEDAIEIVKSLVWLGQHKYCA